MTVAVRVTGLRKSYGTVEAVKGVDLEIARGEVFGLLGPNGAGKTTTVEILEGYRPRDAGTVEVLGFDPGEATREFRERIGVVLQQSELAPSLTVRETHQMFADYYSRPRDVDEVIELVGLAEKHDARVKTLSGGQKRRLDLGIALIGDPELVFLDEPTTGFDPAARRTAWELIRSLRDLGKTVFLTTHYLDEAQQLADRVAVMRGGVIVAQGTPDELTRGGDETEIRWVENGERDGDDHRTDAGAARGDGQGAGRGSRARRARGAAADRSRTSTSTWSASLDGRGGGDDDVLDRLRWEQRLFWRNREAAVFVFIFPPLLYLLLVAVYSNEIDGLQAADVLLAGLIGYGCANTAFAGLAITQVIRRENGHLKRLRATPLPMTTYFSRP